MSRDFYLVLDHTESFQRLNGTHRFLVLCLFLKHLDGSIRDHKGFNYNQLHDYEQPREADKGKFAIKHFEIVHEKCIVVS
jgi:hypothetical protein